MAEDQVIEEVRFSEKYVKYHVFQISFALGITIIGIPLLILIVPLVWYIRTLELKHISMALMSKSLKVRRGVFNKVEKTIPLEKITDLAIYQGPIMRYFGLEGLTVETAGQSGEGSLVALVGIEDVRGFRDRALAQKELLAGRASDGVVTGEAAVKADESVLVEIRDSLLRIEEKLSRD